MDRSQEAVNLFEQGYSCSQSVLTAYALDFDLDSDPALRIASSFGGGMGRMGEVCGAVSGALMVLGLRYGYTRPEDKAAKENLYNLVRQFSERFRQQHGTILCRSLLQCDLSDPQQQLLAQERGVFKTFCPQLIRTAADILNDML